MKLQSATTHAVNIHTQTRRHVELKYDFFFVISFDVRVFVMDIRPKIAAKIVWDLIEPDEILISAEIRPLCLALMVFTCEHRFGYSHTTVTSRQNVLSFHLLFF